MSVLSLLLMASGAVLTFAITQEVEGVDLDALGLVLMAVGIIGLIVSLVQEATPHIRRERHVSEDGRHIVEEDWEARI